MPKKIGANVSENARFTKKTRRIHKKLKVTKNCRSDRRKHVAKRFEREDLRVNAKSLGGNTLAVLPSRLDNV